MACDDVILQFFILTFSIVPTISDDTTAADTLLSALTVIVFWATVSVLLSNVIS